VVLEIGYTFALGGLGGFLFPSLEEARYMLNRHKKSRVVRSLYSEGMRPRPLLLMAILVVVAFPSMVYLRWLDQPARVAFPVGAQFFVLFSAGIVGQLARSRAFGWWLSRQPIQ
jgi:hypothetical protein